VKRHPKDIKFFCVPSLPGSAYTYTGQHERAVEWYRTELARDRDTHTFTRTCLVLTLASIGAFDEAMTAATGLIDAAEDTHNPLAVAWALHAHGYACRNADPDRARETLRRGLVIAQDSGNRAHASVLAPFLARLEAEHGDPVSAFDHLTLAIRNYHNAGDPTTIRVPLCVLAVLFDRLGRYEPAATIAGFAAAAATGLVPEITTAIAHLRDVLGDQTYESLARQGETMTTAAMVTYAYDQIDQARTELEHPS
jgi:tetratricopeptide (TPR) repeat protein